MDFSAGQTDESKYIQESIKKLVSASNNLNTLFNDQVGQISTFFGEDCNKAFLHYQKIEDPNNSEKIGNIFMKDICQQTGGLCTWGMAGDEEASRIGCACAENPIGNVYSSIADSNPVLDVCKSAEAESRDKIEEMIKNTNP